MKQMNVSFRVFMVTAILLGWVAFNYVVISENRFQASVHLPFELCNMMQATILVGYLLNNQKFIHIIAYPLILGPIIALSYPVGLFELGGFYSFYFVYYHATLLITGCYALYLKGFNTSWKQVLYAGLFMMAASVIATVVNVITGGNYMFIGKPLFGFSHIEFYGILFVVSWIGLPTFHLLVRGIYKLRQAKVHTPSAHHSSKPVKQHG